MTQTKTITEKKPNFTKEELDFIEKIMDIQYSFGLDKFNTFEKLKQIGTNSKVEEEIISNGIFELNRSLKVVKSIRDKLEEVKQRWY